jgi:hypothetical protein
MRNRCKEYCSNRETPLLEWNDTFRGLGIVNFQGIPFGGIREQALSMQKHATKTSIKGHNMAKGPDFEKQEPLSAGPIGARSARLDGPDRRAGDTGTHSGYGRTRGRDVLEATQPELVNYFSEPAGSGPG